MDLPTDTNGLHKGVDLSHYRNALSRRHQLLRAAWSVAWTLLARPLPRSVGCGWKRLLLRAFGAHVDSTAVVYSSARIYYPPNLTMGKYSCLASNVDCYNVAPISIGDNTTVSQGAMLCTASHDVTDPLNRLITAPIVIEDQAWVATGAFIGLGVTIGQGVVVGARACVFKDVEAWTIVGGNPAKVLKRRELKKVNGGGYKLQINFKNYSPAHSRLNLCA